MVPCVRLIRSEFWNFKSLKTPEQRDAGPRTVLEEVLPVKPEL